MGVRGNNINVDFGKLKNEFYKRGMTMGDAATQMGRSYTYFSGMRSKGYLPETTLILIDRMWNIKYEDVAPTVVEEPKTVEEPTASEAETVTISRDELRYIITEAIKDAFVWYANY